MDLLERPTVPRRHRPVASVGALPPSQAILAVSFGCSVLVLLVASLVSVLVG